MYVCIWVGTNLGRDPAQETLEKIFLGQLGLQIVVSNLREMRDEMMRLAEEETKTIIQL